MTTTQNPIAAARHTFIAQFESLADAIAFEDRCLSVGDALLPECARAVLVSRDAETIDYWTWLCGQVDAIETFKVAEDARLLAEVESTYTAAAGTWTGRSWDDGDKVIPESTDDQIAVLVRGNEPVAITCWGVDESDERYRRRVRQAITDLVVAWNANDTDSFSRACDRLRQLAEESDAGVAAQAKLAEGSAAEAIKSARAGLKQTALSHADHAAAAERAFGDAPTWAPFAEAVRAWSEHEVE